MILPQEKQVVSLEIAKELCELGVKQDSLYSFTVFPNDKVYLNQGKAMATFNSKYNPEVEYYSAFTVAELGELLPDSCASFNHKLNKEDIRWRCEYGEDAENIEFADTEANARGSMLVYLLKNKLIEVPK